MNGTVQPETVVRFFDSHAHYTDERFTESDQPDLFRRLEHLFSNCLSGVIAPSVRLSDTEAQLLLADHFPGYHPALGIFPSEISESEDMDSCLAMLDQTLDTGRFCAIGEVGLEYHYEGVPHELQLAYLHEQFRLATKHDLPLILHDREAHEDILSVLRSHPDVRGVVHCFSGSAETAKEILKLGWSISFTGVITFKNARKALEALEVIPLDRLLIETDAPYMAPEPRRGTVNDSGNLIWIAKKMAEIKGVSVDEIADCTTANTERLFGVSRL